MVQALEQPGIQVLGQYNSPIGLYSSSNAAQQFAVQTESALDNLERQVVDNSAVQMMQSHLSLPRKLITLSDMGLP